MNVPETFFSVNEEVYLFGLSCLFGAVIGVCYDFFRAFRLIIRHNSVMVFAEDLAFFIGYCLFLTAFTSAAARSSLRVYFIIGNFIGFTVYLLTVGSIVIRTLQKLIKLTASVFRIVFYPLNKFIAFIRQKTGIKFVECSENFLKPIKYVKKGLLSKHNLLYNKTEIKKRKFVDNFGKKKKR